jgi:ketosteroid isomerase-like protein
MDPALEARIHDVYAAYARGDVDALLEAFAPNATLVNPEYAVDGGVRQGRDELGAALIALHEQFAYEELEVERIEEGPAGVAVDIRMVVSGRSSGARLEQRFSHVLRLRDELVVELLWFSTPAEGRRAAGLD